MKKLICILLFLLPLILQAQRANVDSLVNVLETQKLTDDEKIDIQRTIIRLYLNNDWGKCLKYAKQGIALAEKEKNAEALADLYNLISYAYHYGMGTSDSAIISVNKGLEWAKKINKNSSIAVLYGTLGTLYKENGDFALAIDSYMKDLSLNDEMNTQRSTTLVNLSSAHRALQHWDRAMEYAEQALTIADKLNSDGQKMGIYYSMANITSDKGDKDKAIELAKQSLEISKKINNKQYQIISTLLIATSYSSKKDTEKALRYAEEGMRIAEEFGVKKLLLSVWITLSDIYREAGRYKDSEAIALKAWAEDSTSLQEASYTAFNLAIANIHLGNKQKAEHYVFQFQDIIFKGHDKQMSESLADMETKYETEKKELRIADLEREKILYIAIGIACFLLAALTWIFLRQKIKNEQREKQLIAANAVLEWEKKERKRFASDLHDGINGMLAAIKFELGAVENLQNIRNRLDECIEAIRSMSRSRMPTSLQRYGLKASLEDYCRLFPNVDFHFYGNGRRMDEKLELTVYYCAYELVNNASKYSGAKSINVQLVQDDDSVSLTVQDDGCGFDEQSVKEGSGLKSIRDRVASLGGKIDIATSPGKGTEINIELQENRD